MRVLSKMINNIDAYRPKHETKGNGNNQWIAHHKKLVQGKIVKRLADGCWRNAHCEGCKIPVDLCSGNIIKVRINNA
jgi:hypothetical protein